MPTQDLKLSSWWGTLDVRTPAFRTAGAPSLATPAFPLLWGFADSPPPCLGTFLFLLPAPCAFIGMTLVSRGSNLLFLSTPDAEGVSFLPLLLLLLAFAAFVVAVPGRSSPPVCGWHHAFVCAATPRRIIVAPIFSPLFILC